MFGIPSMIRALTSSVTSVFNSTTTATDALASMADSWSESIISLEEKRTQDMIESKSKEISESLLKTREELEKLGDQALYDAKIAVKSYYIRKNKPVPVFLEAEITKLETILKSK
jgi:hypothetical protein